MNWKQFRKKVLEQEMNRKETEERQITIHWWNLGTKTLDFKGSYKDYFLEKGIKVKEIKHPSNKDVNGLRFTFGLSSSNVKLDTFGSNYIEEYNKAILIYPTLLGDKTIFRDGYGREYKINWRWLEMAGYKKELKAIEKINELMKKEVNLWCFAKLQE